jgi:hypothetical protein
MRLARRDPEKGISMSRLPAIALCAAAVAALSAGAQAQSADERTSTAADRVGVALTVYQQDLGLVRDRRKVSFADGDNTLAFSGVSVRLMPQTARLAVRDGAPLAVFEQSFETELLNYPNLLEAAVGQRVRIVRTNEDTGAETVQEAELLAARDGIVLRVGDRIETAPAGRLVFDSIPAGLRPQPTLVAGLRAEGAGAREIELAYLTGGLGWSADYVASLGPDDDRLDLTAWATVRNDTDSAFADAALALVAGDVNRVSTAPVPAPMAKARQVLAMAAPQDVERAPVGDYHLYRIGRPIDLARGQHKQVLLLQRDGVDVAKRYRVEAGFAGGRSGEEAPLPVTVTLNFANDAQAAEPLPAGVVRVYGASGDGVFLGEDRIAQTAAGEEVSLDLGRAFDVTAKLLQTDFRRLGAKGEITEAARRVRLGNASAKPVTVEVVERFSGNWEILEESTAHKKTSAFTAEWSVPVPAGGETVLTYKLRLAPR